MKSRFTGGQYSVFRFLLGNAAAMQLATFLELPEAPFSATSITQFGLVIVSIVACLLVMLGVKDRVQAVFSGVFVILVPGSMGVEISYGSALLCVLLFLHALTPPAPYGSWAARKRTDPRGDWHMPARVHRLHWIVLCVAYAYAGALSFDSAAPATNWIVPIALLAFGPLCLIEKIRWPLWLLFLVGSLITFAIALFNFDASTEGAWLLLHLFAFDPAWIKPTQRDKPTLVFYDGTCGLCHRAIRFFLAEDAYENLRFAPLQGTTLKESIGDRDPKSLPDSLIVFTQDGEMLVRSAAVLEAMSRLGGMWRLIASLYRICPRFVLDIHYKQVAVIRQQFFAKPKQLCPILPPDLASRFLP